MRRLFLPLLASAIAIACTATFGEAPAPSSDAPATPNVGASTASADGGAGSTTPDAAAVASESPDVPPLSAAELARPWAKLAVPQAKSAPIIARTPQGGFVALALETTGGKAGGPSYNYFYRSDDGIQWHRAALPATDNAPYAGKTHVVYGAGRYLMIEWRAGGAGRLWTSTDLVQWLEASLPQDHDGGDLLPFDAQQIIRIHGLFVAIGGTSSLFVSSDGVAWTRIAIPLIQGRDIAYGNGTLMLQGALSIRTSQDGLSWDDHTPVCGTPNLTCVGPPGGGQTFATLNNVAFLDGQFYVDHLKSTDGVTWQQNTDPVIANRAIGGYLFNYLGEQTPNGIEDRGLRVWRPGEPVQTITTEPPVASTPLAAGVGPDTITTPLPTGETCLSHRCLIINRAVYLIR